MSQPRARIASQLGLALALILALVISGSTLFALRSLDSANLDTREEHLASEARLHPALERTVREPLSQWPERAPRRTGERGRGADARPAPGQCGAEQQLR